MEFEELTEVLALTNTVDVECRANEDMDSNVFKLVADHLFERILRAEPRDGATWTGAVRKRLALLLGLNLDLEANMCQVCL